MVYVSAYRLGGSDDDILYDSMRDRIPRESYEKTLGMKLKEDRLRTFFGYMVLGYMLRKYFFISEYELIYNEYGKPYIKGENIHFNISHSGDMVVCVVSKCENGIDTERIAPMDIVNIRGILKHISSENEAKLVLPSPAGETECSFYNLWTAKEALVKCIGCGITEAKSYSICTLPDGSMRALVKGKAYYIKNTDLLSGYSTSLCLSEDFSIPEMTVLKADDFLNLYVEKIPVL